MVVIINGETFDCVSHITPSIIYDYNHDVTTMDGVIHRSLRGKRTNYEILFYNKNHTEYEKLKNNIVNWVGAVDLTVPTGAETTETAQYLVETNGDELKGRLWDGKNYFNGLSLTFTKVAYDEAVSI